VAEGSGDPVLVVKVAGDTDVGMKRRLNEDEYLVDRERGLFLVADGMGGHAAGEVASRLAAEAIVRAYDERAGAEGETWPAHWSTERSALANRLVDAILAGHEQVTRAVRHDPDLKGMGTTVVVALNPPGSRDLIIGHVGDSRAYRYRRGEFGVLTRDHSWVHEQVAAGFLTEESARSHPLKNVVTQALGGSTEPRVDVLEVEMESGDVYLLCSDGLNSMLEDEEIGGFIEEDQPLEEISRQLIVASNERGGNDNITVILLRVEAA